MTFQQIKSWFQLVEKFEHVQTFQLIDNENEWIAFSMEEWGSSKSEIRVNLKNNTFL